VTGAGGQAHGAHASGLPAWPGIDEEAVAATCAVIARRLVLSQKKSVGVLPVGGAPNLGPLLVRLAVALARFGEGKVGVIPRWRTWARDPGGAEGAAADASRVRLRAMGPDVVAIVPPAAGDVREAALVLQPALWDLPAGLTRVLVDLSGYSKPGVWPGTGVLVDGVVLAVPRRIARRSSVERLLATAPAGKCMGSILLG
jgi:hypothetical protein